MANETLGASFTIDVTDLKAGLAQANRMIRESESEFKAAAAGMDDWRESEEGLTAKIKSLNSITDVQQAKVDALQKEYKGLIAKGLDPSSKAAVELRTKINNETAALNKNKAEAKKLSKELDEMGDSAEEAGDSTDDLGGSFEGLKGAGGVAAGAIAAVATACVAAVSAFLGLAESTREARNNMAKLQTSFETAGLSAEAAESTFTELYSILGDDGTATEAAQQLAKISKNETDLATNTRILTGVMAEYGDSIPTSGLAEGMAATAAMGEVQGVLADALEWQGVNLDEYNAKLATLATEEERAAYIQSTLTDLYGASADAYRENNAEIIAANEAQAGLNQALNELGAIAEPIMTTLKQLATDLLTSITPFVTLIGEGLTGALNGAEGAADSLAEGLTGIFETLLDKAVSLLPFAIESILAIAPKILSALLAQLPSITQTLLSMVVQIVNTVVSADLFTKIIDAILLVIPQIVSAITGAIPQVLEAAISLAMSIVRAIPHAIVGLSEALPTVIRTILEALISATPLILQSSVQLLMAIISAIPEIIVALTENLPLIINAILDSLLGSIPLILQGSVDLLMAICDAIPTISVALFRNIPLLATTIVSTLLSRTPEILAAAVKLLWGIISAIPKVIVGLVKSIPSIITAIVGGLKDGTVQIVKAGGDLIRGLWQGISDMGGWIKKKIEGFGGDVLGSLKDFFGIHSPSAVMADEVGKNLALGIGEGFEENIAGVNKQITGAMNFDSSGGAGAVGNVGERAGGGVVVYQTNNYSQAHSRIELYKTKQATAAAVRLAMAGA